MNIPSDTGVPWRWNKLVEFTANADYDYTFAIVCPYADAHNLNLQQRVWLAYLYSTCYCAPTTCLLQYFLPTIESATPEKVQKLWKTHKDGLVFNSDRRYVKNLDMFPRMVEQFRGICGDKPTAFVDRFADPNKDTFYGKVSEAIYKTLYGFGEMSAMLFVEALYKLTPYDMDSVLFDWQKGLTCTEGMLHALYMDSEALSFQKGKRKLSQREVLQLDGGLGILMHDYQVRTGKRLTIYDAETSLCFYRKLYKAHKYTGSSIDNQQIQVERMESAKCNADVVEDFWWEMWDLRQEMFRHDLLGEKNNRKGFQEHKWRDWIEKGMSGAEIGATINRPYTYKQRRFL